MTTSDETPRHGLVSELHELGAFTTDSEDLTVVQACAQYEMPRAFFDRAWPAYFAEVEHASPGVASHFRYAPLRPGPDPVGLILAFGDAPSRPVAVVLRNPWDTIDVTGAEYEPFVREVEAGIRHFTQELTAWVRDTQTGFARYGEFGIPATMKEAGAKQKAAIRRLVKPIVQKTRRKLSSFRYLSPGQYELLLAELHLAELQEAGRRIEATVARGREVFDSDLDVQDATIRRLEVIGQCVRNLETSSRRQSLRHVPWGRIAAMRDKLAKDFVGIDLEIVWHAASEGVPKIMAALLRDS